MSKDELATLTCPECGHKQKHPIPKANICVAIYKCGGCGKLIQAKKTCCVVCDYSDKKCPVGHHTKT